MWFEFVYREGGIVEWAKRSIKSGGPFITQCYLLLVFSTSNTGNGSLYLAGLCVTIVKLLFHVCVDITYVATLVVVLVQLDSWTLHIKCGVCERSEPIKKLIAFFSILYALQQVNQAKKLASQHSI